MSQTICNQTVVILYRCFGSDMQIEENTHLPQSVSLLLSVHVTCPKLLQIF